MVRETKLYERLNISSEATPDEIKKAYRQLAIKYHPDKNPDPQAGEMFKEISEAYEILSDPEKRQRYDQLGMEGMKNEPHLSPEDIFSQFFPNFPGFGQGRRQNENDIVIACVITLNEAYTGITKKVSYETEKSCLECHGTGSKDGKTIAMCPQCQGKGIVNIVQQHGMFIQQIRTSCPKCQGRKKMVDKEGECSLCHGKGKVKENKEKEVEIPGGIGDQEPIIFEGEGRSPDGNLVIVVQIDDRSTAFSRQGDNLILKEEIALSEALTGFVLTIKHLDGREIHVECKDIVRPQDIYRLEGEGMPVHHSSKKGDLFIVFEVIFPGEGEIKKENVEELRKILPEGKHKKRTKNKKYHQLKKYQGDRERREQGSRPQQVQCAQQ